MIPRLLTLLLLPLLLFSCSDRYQAFRTMYKFKSPDGTPVYGNLDYWAAHPWKWDPSDSVPLPLRKEWRDTSVDVFFLYPTTFTKKRKSGKHANAAIDDDYVNAKTDYSTILYQASVFNQQSRIFSPRYRQAHIYNFFRKDKQKAKKAFDLAYADIKTAFEYYLQHWNKGRPMIIASHSQGSLLAEQLLKDYFDDGALKSKLVAAYIVGWSVTPGEFATLNVCSDSLATGCICSWRTLRNGFVPWYLKNEKGDALVTNPLTWTTGDAYAPRELNKGSVLTNFNKAYNYTTGAKISNGLLYVEKPKFPGSFFYFTRNYHIADINLFYFNLRENVRQRIASYFKKTVLIN